MLPGAFSGTLLDADFGGSGAPAFLGTAAAAGAACDPAAFFISDADADNPLQPPQLGGSPQHPASLQQQLKLQQQQQAQPAAASARDLLRELESSADYLLPAPGTDPVEDLLLGDAPATAPGGSGAVASDIDTGSGLPWHALSFPTIPEEAELPQAQAQLLPSPAAAAAAAAAAVAAPLSPQLPALAAAPAPPPSLFIPVPSAIRTAAPKLFPASPVSAIDADHAGGAHSSGHSEAASPTASSTSSGEGEDAPGSARAGGGGAGGGGMPRIVSMPNLHLSLEEDAAAGATPHRRAAGGGGGRAMPRSRSHGNLGGHGSTGDLHKYNVPHLPFLTPPHLRKGKGGRQPASDPRLDPRIDPKKARRIMANRLSAAKSKMKQKSSAQVERQRSEMQRLQLDHLMPDAPNPAEEE